MTQQQTSYHRVKALAERLDVSVATIYRAIESGALQAVKVGTGKGALRIPAAAVDEYLQACELAARQSSTPTVVADGVAR
ncbi:MAG: helix-turn-helix transcriptional regulator [Pseudonocardiaceae bacterium]